MVEFAIVAAVFLTLMLGIMDFGRMLFTWNATAEATRWGARIAVVCDKLTPDQVRDKMKQIMPQLTNANIVINWYNPEGVDQQRLRQIELQRGRGQHNRLHDSDDLAFHGLRHAAGAALRDLSAARKHGSDQRRWRQQPGLPLGPS